MASQITPQLFLSDYDTATYPEVIESGKITHILTLVTEVEFRKKKRYEDHITHVWININDSASEDLLAILDRCIEFIEQGIAKGGNVLVHCGAGMSRSASIVIAYIMKSMKYDYLMALDYVRAQRPIVMPNYGFEKQVQFYRELGFSVKGDSEQHQLYRKLCDENGKFNVKQYFKEIEVYVSDDDIMWY